MTRWRIAVAVLLVALTGQAGAEWESARLETPVLFNKQVIPYPEFAVYVMPGARLRAGSSGTADAVTVTFEGREYPPGGEALRAPNRPGAYDLRIRNSRTGEEAKLNVITMVPASGMDKDGRLNGYRIGAYPDEPLRGLDIYLPPNGFVEVTRENAKTRVSPNFTLGQFVAKQESDYPKYVVLRASLLLKLENILAALNGSGRRTEGLVIMSGYRTPFYNRAIGNTRYSRHVWGGAADIFVDDSPADGRMDDMNGDGRVDRGDAEWLAAFVDRMSKNGDFGPRVGGIGVYGSNSAHGPFVHVDVRGTRARW